MNSHQIILDYLDKNSNSKFFVIYYISSDTFESIATGKFIIHTKEEICTRMLHGPFSDMIIYEISNDHVIDYLCPVINGTTFAEEVDYFAKSGGRDVPEDTMHDIFSRLRGE